MTTTQTPKTPVERASLWARSKRRNRLYVRWTDEQIALAASVAHNLSVGEERQLINAMKGRSTLNP